MAEQGTGVEAAGPLDAQALRAAADESAGDQLSALEQAVTDAEDADYLVEPSLVVVGAERRPVGVFSRLDALRAAIDSFQADERIDVDLAFLEQALGLGESLRWTRQLHA